MNRGGRPATGSIEWTGCRCVPPCVPRLDHWHARVTLADGTRQLAPLDPTIAQDDLEAAKACALLTSQHARDTGAVDRRRGLTVAEYAEAWIADREKRQGLDTRNDEARMRDHILPIVGHLEIRKVTSADLRRLVADLDRKSSLTDRAKGRLSWKTARNVWTLATTMFRNATSSKIEALRVRDDNPANGVEPPDRGGDNEHQYLYPDEFGRFAACDDVPLRWRRVVALAVYLGTRDGELRALRWEDVDLEHGIVSLNKSVDRWRGGDKGTKSDTPRRFAIEPHLLPLLHAMRAEDRKATYVIELSSHRSMARNLRRWLIRAGVTRAELHKRSASRKPLRFHDLRATFITWSALRGDSPLVIQHRAGHTSLATTQIYIREAESIRGSTSAPFAPLPTSILGGRKVSAEVSALSASEIAKSAETQEKMGGVDGTRTRAEIPANLAGSTSDGRERAAETDTTPSAADQPPPTRHDGASQPLTIDLLRSRLDAAIVAEQWEAVKVIGARLRELERAGVVDLETERARRR